MGRTYVVTGAASGIGLATCMLLKERQHHVIGADLHSADIQVDLGTAQGRKDLAEHATALSGGVIDGVIACAGVSLPATLVTSVNYFGMMSTLNDLRPCLSRSASPRAVAVSSFAAIWPGSDELFAALKAGDEELAISVAHSLVEDERALRARLNWPEGTAGPNPAYHSAKLAIAAWVRRMAPTSEWAGAGIALNAVAPGMINTRLTEHVLRDPAALSASEMAIPRPLNGIAEPVVVARLLAWLTSEENSHLCGQVIFIDGGAEAITRGDSII